MDDILNITDDDISDFLDIPNDDEIFREIDSLEFTNEIENDLIYEYEIEKQLSNGDTYKQYTDLYHSHENNVNYSNNNVYGNNFGNTTPNCINVAQNKVHDNAEQKLMIIRELLDSNIHDSTNGIMSALQNNTHRGNSTKPLINTNSPHENSKTNNHRNITSKPPPILPAMNNSSSSNILKTPTLAATLIGMQPSKMTTNTLDNHSGNTGGRVVRRNSHNAIEKRYRLSINDKIDELRHMLFLGDDSKMNKSNVLKKAVERIKCLEDENNALKRENYNLRISKNLPIINNRNSIESLNQTGSSRSSNNSDGGHSIENSPSSSSMHSSVNSGCLFLNSVENSEQNVSNSNRGTKRPLIYNSNNNNDNSTHIVKNEKLARLLLDHKDEYSNRNYEAQGNRNFKKLHSSNVPGFLLCGIALFVVSFQPFDFLLKKYQSKYSTITGGRQLLFSNHGDFSSQGYLFALFLTLAHWSVAFILVYGSASNRFFLKKMVSLLSIKLQSSLWSSYLNKMTHPTHNLVELKIDLKENYQNHNLFRSRIESLAEEYGCSYQCNPLMKVFQFTAYLLNFFTNFLQTILNQNKCLSEARKINVYILTVIIDQATIGQLCYSKFEIFWYKILFFLSSWNLEINDEILFSKFTFALSISTGFIRRYFLKKIFETANRHQDLVSCRLQLFLLNNNLQEMLIKTSPESLMNKFDLQNMDKGIDLKKQSLMNYYFMNYAQETIESASQIILDEKPHSDISGQLKDIINYSSAILNDNESTYFSLWCGLLLELLKDQNSQHINKMVMKLINHYSSLSKMIVIKNSNDSITSSVGILKLLFSTLQLYGNEEDKLYHEINIKCMESITQSTNMNVVFRMILRLSLTRIVQSLKICNSNNFTNISNIVYYANAYSKQLSNHYKHQSEIEVEMLSEFEVLFHNLCQLNPMKFMALTLQEKDSNKSVSSSKFKNPNDNCFRITDFLSLERDSKLRSH